MKNGHLMLASLSMYDRPELKAHNQVYWSEIRRALYSRGIESPKLLTEEGTDLAFWGSPKLFLSQTCGLPYRKYLHNKVNLVGTPDCGVKGCPPGYYCSYFIVRKNDKRNSLPQFNNSVFAYNEKNSQSGFASAWNHLKSLGFWFQNIKITGSHLRSAHSLVNGEADIAAIDAVTWRFIKKYEAIATELRILEATEPTPGLPYITSKTLKSDVMFDAIEDVIKNLAKNVLRELNITGIIKIPKARYLAIPLP
jgi:ABC-type phosphate/phosphonate transport system substrate-binding protein